MNSFIGLRHKQRLLVGVDGDELNAFQASFNHAVNGVGATTTDANDLNDGQQFSPCFLQRAAFTAAFNPRPPRQAHKINSHYEKL